MQSILERMDTTSATIRRANLDVLIKEAGGKVELAKLLGKKPNYLSQVHRPNGKERPIGPRLARSVELAMKRPRGWMDVSHDPVNTGDNGLSFLRSPLVRLITWVQAGGMEGMMTLDGVGGFDGELINAPPSASTSAFALRVRGDSMVNTAGALSFPAESIIVVDPNIPAVPGYPVVVKLVDAAEAVFKIYEFDGKDYFLKPLNPRYPIVPMPADARVIGVVISVQLETLPFLPSR